MLGVQVEIRERLGSPLGLDQPQHLDPFFARQSESQLGQVGGKPAVERLAKRRFVAVLDQLSDRGQSQLSQHCDSSGLLAGFGWMRSQAT